MKPRSRILKWCAVALFLKVCLAGLIPVSYHIGPSARIAETRALIGWFEMACRAYKTEYGGFPSGTPPEMVAVLTGKNQRGIRFLELPERGLNQAGEPIDPWKTPLRIEHVPEGDPPKLISAGPDKIFGTKDDVTSGSQ